jgi:hypothetical protein
LICNFNDVRKVVVEPKKVVENLKIKNMKSSLNARWMVFSISRLITKISVSQSGETFSEKDDDDVIEIFTRTKGSDKKVLRPILCCAKETLHLCKTSEILRNHCGLIFSLLYYTHTYNNIDNDHTYAKCCKIDTFM